MRVKNVDLMLTQNYAIISHLDFDQAVDWVIERTKIEMSRAGRKESEEEKMAELVKRLDF